MQRHWTLALAITFLPPVAWGAERTDEARLLIDRMSAQYESMRTGVSMRAEVWKRTSLLETTRESRRKYRFVLRGGDLRTDLFGGGAAVITRMRKGGMVLLYSSLLNRYAGHGENDPAAGDTPFVLDQFRITFFDRFAHLARANPRITGVKEESVKAGRERKTCLRIGIRAAEGVSPEWKGGVWVERTTALVWRATMSVRDREGVLIEEDVRLEDIRSGGNVGVEELNWRPPDGTLRIPKWEHTLPY